MFVYDDRIEISSYGGLPYGLSEDGFFAGTSKPVNRRLFDIFIACGYCEQSGHGIPQIVKSYGKEAFSFRDGMLVVTLTFAYVPEFVAARQARSKARETLNNNQKAVLLYFADHRKATLREAAQACSLSLGGVKKVVQKLQELGLLERRGPRNASSWEVR